MQPDVRFLNGIWEGSSVPFRRDKESTKWVDCDLSFESSSVTGTGTSQWCGQTISFRISGKYDASTGIFEITKKHEGKFMNVLLFRGRIDFERRELRGQYRSGNFYLVQTSARPPKPSVDSKRVLHPRPTIQQTGHALSHLSGGWDGEYISHKRREITIWRNCSLEFTLQSGQGQFGKLEGQGESLWRGEVIPFKLTGTFDLKQLWVDLLKTHTGKYTNTGQYRMSLDLKHVQMTGDDGYGTLTLKKFSGHSATTSTTTTTSSYMPSASSSPSTPTRPISPSSQNSRGPLSPSMPGLESYRRAVPNSSQSGNNGGASSNQSFFRSQSIPSSSSVSRSSSTTSTEDFFEKENNKNQLKTVDYDDFDSSSLEITRIKLGKLTTDDLSTPKSTTTIIENTPAQEKFICYLDGMMSHTPSSTIPPSMIQDKRVTKDMYILSAKQSQAISDFRFKHKISEDDNKLVLSQLKIVDVYSTTMYDSTPTISYEKRRSFTREDELSPTSYSPHPRSTYPSTRSSRLLSGSSRGGGSETGGDSNSVSGDSVETEQSSIGGSGGGGGDEPYVSVTGEPDVGHDAYAFFEPEPQSVKEVPSPISPNVEEESADLCKVCFDAKMNCVIVPCGHFSICMKCAILLTNCPVCRGKIEQRQLVYRA